MIAELLSRQKVGIGHTVPDHLAVVPRRTISIANRLLNGSFGTSIVAYIFT